MSNKSKGIIAASRTDCENHRGLHAAFKITILRNHKIRRERTETGDSEERNKLEIEKQTKRRKELGFSVYKCWGLKQTFVQCRRERLQNQNIHSLLFSLSPLNLPT